MNRTSIAAFLGLFCVAGMYAYEQDMANAKHKEEVYAQARSNRAVVLTIAKKNPELANLIVQLKSQRDMASSPSTKSELNVRIDEASRGYDIMRINADTLIDENEGLIQELRALPRQFVWKRYVDARDIGSLSLLVYKGIPNQLLEVSKRTRN